MSFKLIVSIVPHECGELITSAANSAGANGGTIIMARGTAENSILQLLGLGDTFKDITYSIIDSSLYRQVYSAILKAVSEKKKHFGVMFGIDVNQFVKAGNMNSEEEKENNMKNESSYQVINVIVNKGYAEDAMAAARKAGAGGGTIIGARGTAKEDDAKFFGMKIVQEKEMLMILVPAEKKEGIIASIKALPCFSQAGSGIVFCNDAEDFTFLGKD